MGWSFLEGIGAALIMPAIVALVGSMSVLAGLFAVYVVVQVFRNPSRRRSP
mgnify:CR=1 FL=1